jgi:hypothetical protein
MLDRMNSDLKQSAEKLKSSKQPRLTFLGQTQLDTLKKALQTLTSTHTVTTSTSSKSETEAATILQTALEQIEKLLVELRKLLENDAHTIGRATTALLLMANSGSGQAPDKTPRVVYELQRTSGQQVCLCFSFLLEDSSCFTMSFLRRCSSGSSY